MRFALLALAPALLAYAVLNAQQAPTASQPEAIFSGVSAVAVAAGSPVTDPHKVDANKIKQAGSDQKRAEEAP